MKSNNLYKLPGKYRPRGGAVAIYNPTHAQIERECTRIQESWTPQERERRRCGGVLVEWVLPRMGPVPGELEQY